MVRRTKEEAQRTRERILDTAEREFQRRGVSRTSLEEMARAAGVTRGAIYWHFKDKADLFNAMMKRVTLPLESEILRSGERDARRPAGADPRQLPRRAARHGERPAGAPRVRDRHPQGRVRQCAARRARPPPERPARAASRTSSAAFAAPRGCGLRTRRDPGARRRAGPALADRRADPELDARPRGLRPGARGRSRRSTPTCAACRPTEFVLPARVAAGTARGGSCCGGRRCAPTALRCSHQGRAAELTALPAVAAFRQPRQVSSRSALARADPGAALLVAPEIAPSGQRLPRQPPVVACGANTTLRFSKGAPGQAAARL